MPASTLFECDFEYILQTDKKKRKAQEETRD